MRPIHDHEIAHTRSSLEYRFLREGLLFLGLAATLLSSVLYVGALAEGSYDPGAAAGVMASGVFWGWVWMDRAS